MDEKIKNWLIVNGDIVSIADFKKIRDDLLEDYKYIFKLVKKEMVDGVEVITPLDIPEYSADYIYNNNLALSIWNLLTELKNLYKQHNIQFAKGKYLDKLLGLYNQTRVKQRTYVAQIGLTEVADIDSLIGQELSSTNGYTFRISSFVKTTGSSPDPLSKINYYYIDAIDYYESLQPTQISELELLWVGTELGVFVDRPLLILTQRKEETDQSFLSRINLRSEYSQFVKELLKINEVQDVIIFTSDMYDEVFNKIGAPSLEANQLFILINFREDFYSQNEEIRDSISVDVRVTIQEFLPLGVKGLSKGIVPEWQLSANDIPFSDFISRTINYYYKTIQRPIVKCVISNVYRDSLDDDLKDLLSEWESEDVFTPYEIDKSEALSPTNKLLILLNKYLRVDNTSIKSKVLVSNTRIMTDEEIEALVVRTTNAEGEVIKLEVDLSLLPTNIVPDIPVFKLNFKPTISRYRYWKRPDGDYEIVFY